MESILFGFVPLVVAVVLLFSAFRAHERYWALGFMGWRKVYAGLILYMFSSVLTAAWQWTMGSGPEAIGRVVLWQVISALVAAAGIGLVLAGAIERLRELSEERERLEDIRAGFDLFDSLREIAAQPYAFLEILDFSLKEMVRAAGVECGGLWLYNPGKSEWVLTGWAGMSEKLRQQTESIRGHGTGFDRLSITHKARLFHSTEEIRAFFPEWEPEGFQSVLGLPLATGAVGTPGRQILGAVILADRSPSHFDNDRARRLFAASDYIAAVIAEARITRQLEAARQQQDSTQTEREGDRLEFQRQLETCDNRIQDMKAAWDNEKRSLEQDVVSRLSDIQARADEEIGRTRAEREREGQEFERQRATYETRIQDMMAAWGDEKRSLEQDFASRLSDIQARADEEIGRTRTEREREGQEFERQRATYETRIQDMMAAWAGEKRSLEDNLASQVSDIRTQAKEEIDRTRAEFETRAVAAAAAEQERTSQLQQRWEEARHDYESALGRFENERAGWGRRLDQLNQDHQTERELARQREEQLVASHRDAQAAMQTRIDELQSQLSAEQQKVAAERDALHAAGQTLAELESALATERNARENAVADMTARIENERRTATQDRQAIEQELNAARQLLEEREKQLSAHLVAARQAAAEAETHYLDTLQAERETAAHAISGLEADLRQEQERSRSVGRELQSVRLMFDERERQFAARIDAERRAFKEMEAGHIEALSDARRRAGDVLRDLEDQLHSQNDRCESLESNLRAVLEEKTASEERARQDLVEQHLSSRRQINAVKARRAFLMDRFQGVLAIARDEQRLSALFGSTSEDLPAPVELYLWRRDPERGAHLVAWMDCDRVVRPAPDQDLPPWSFEVETIPAEGVTLLSGSERWNGIECAHDDSHRARWRQHWGGERRPAWVACWPWLISPADSGSETGSMTGWLTAFGFDSQAIDDEHVVYGGQWAGFLAAMAVGMKRDLAANADTGSEPVAVSEPAPFGPSGESLAELNTVILDWAAGQTEDPLRLDLSARSRVAVQGSWLRDVLDRGRRLCRGTEPQGSEFSISTESQNGQTILRLVRSASRNEVASSGITVVDDADLTAMQVSNLPGPESSASPRPEDAGVVCGRWLIRDGDRLGLELLFNPATTDARSTEARADAPDETHTCDILVVGFQNAMNDLVVGMLESLGHTVRPADFADARALVVAQSIDLVLVSATQDGTGWEFAGWLKTSIPALPVIVVTDDDTAPVADDAMCDQILRIPFQIEELDKAITRLTASATVPNVPE